MNTAVLVIDMLNDFFRDGRLKDNRYKLCNNINTLLSAARKQNLEIFWVRQIFKEDLSDAFLVMKKRNIRITMENSEGAEFLKELDKNENDHEIVKKRYSAFYKTQLEEILANNGIDEIILCGVNTHACIRTAAIDAYQRDLEVIIAKDCVDSPDKRHHDISLQYLGNEISRVLNSKQIINSLLSPTKS
ncbi:MAG: cysteine hydrolase family protein [Chitinophagales bacterium]